MLPGPPPHGELPSCTQPEALATEKWPDQQGTPGIYHIKAHELEEVNMLLILATEEIPEWFGLEETLKPIQSHPLLRAGTPSTLPGCSEPLPVWPIGQVVACYSHSPKIMK